MGGERVVSGMLIIGLSTDLRLPIDPTTRKPPPRFSLEPVEESNTDATKPLPYGWEKRLTGSGRAYYVNHNARTTQWNPPASDVPMNPDPLGPLPVGWEQRLTPKGRPYYVDHNTKTTTFTRPKTYGM